MPHNAATVRRRPALLAAGALLLVALYLAVRRAPPAPPPPLMVPDGWHVPELMTHLASRGLRLNAVASSRATSALSSGAYLSEGERPWEEVAALPVVVARAERWSGVVLVTHSQGHSALLPEDVADWGDNGMRAGPFVFFGDAALLRRIAAALAE